MGNQSSLILVGVVFLVIAIFIFTIIKASMIRNKETTECSKVITGSKKRQ